MDDPQLLYTYLNTKRSHIAEETFPGVSWLEQACLLDGKIRLRLHILPSNLARHSRYATKVRASYGNGTLVGDAATIPYPYLPLRFVLHVQKRSDSPHDAHSLLSSRSAGPALPTYVSESQL